MDDEAEVGLVETHAQGAGGDQRLELVGAQPVLELLALGGVRPAGVGLHRIPGIGECPGHVVGRRDGERVDDARAGEVAQVGGEPGELGLGMGQLEHAQPQGLAGQRPTDREDVVATGPELLGDIGDHPLVGRRRRGQHGRGRGQVEQEVLDAAVVGTEVVAPVGDAVRLVDHEQAAPGRQVGQLLGPEGGVVESLGTDQQDVDVVGLERRRDVTPVGRIGRVHRHGAHPGTLGRGDLVAHQRQERTDDDRRPGTLGTAERRRHEVDGRFAPPGALHHERTLPLLDQCQDRLELPIVEDGLVVADQTTQDDQRPLGHRTVGAGGTRGVAGPLRFVDGTRGPRPGDRERLVEVDRRQPPVLGRQVGRLVPVGLRGQWDGHGSTVRGPADSFVR